MIAPNDTRALTVGAADPNSPVLGKEGAEQRGTPAVGVPLHLDPETPEARAHARLLANANRVEFDVRTDAEDTAIAAELRADAATLIRRIWHLELRLAAAFPRVPGAAGVHRPGGAP